MPDAYYRTPRRRVFPPGTTTEELRFTTTTDEATQLRMKCRAHDTSLSELVVKATLAKHRSLTTKEKGALMHELIGARRDLAQLKAMVDKLAGQGAVPKETAEVLVSTLRVMNDRLYNATEGLV